MAVTTTQTTATLSTSTAIYAASDSSFVGYLFTATSQPPERFQCTDGNYLQSNGFAGCCASSYTGCFQWTSCGSATLYGGGTTLACGSGSACKTNLVFNNYPTNAAAISFIDCAATATTTASTYYRTVITSFVIAQAATITTTLLPSSAATSSSPTITSSVSSPTSTQTPDSSGSGGSKAWIAGAVIGPIVLLALLVALFFFLRRRRNRNNDASTQYTGYSTAPTSMYASPGGMTQSDAPPYEHHGSAMAKYQSPNDEVQQLVGPTYGRAELDGTNGRLGELQG